jgi:small multidrug resistance family-3 protein
MKFHEDDNKYESFTVRELTFLVTAALLEVGGDALVRWGMKGGRILGFILGAVILLTYGVIVNTPKWDFGRLLGIYIAIFFVVSQVLSIVVFGETLRFPTLVAGVLIISGGIVLTIF